MEIVNPPNYEKRIAFALKNTLISFTDILWFVVITVIFLPVITLIKLDSVVQIILAVIYIVLLITFLWRWDGKWLIDDIALLLSNMFKKKYYKNKDARRLTILGEVKEVYFFKNEEYSKYCTVNATDISLIREEELINRIEALNNFFMLNEQVKVSIISYDHPVDVNSDLNFWTHQNYPDEVYNLLAWDQYQALADISNNNLTQKRIMLKITAKNKTEIEKFINLSNIKLTSASISLDTATLDELIAYQQSIYSKMFEIKSNTLAYTKIDGIFFTNNFIKIFFKEFNEKRSVQYFRVLAIRQNPQYANFGWINKIIQTDDIVVINHLRTIKNTMAKQYINNMVNFLKLKYDASHKDLVEETTTINYYQQIAETAEWISDGNVSLLNSQFFIIVTAKNKRALDKKVGVIKDLCKGNKIQLDKLKYKQKNSYCEAMEVK